MIRFIVQFICLFIVYCFGWYIGHERYTSFWRQMEFWPDGGTWRCNRCGRQVMFLKSTPKAENLKYCPGCGAKMNAEGHK